jgi:hypothetical protein
METDLLHGVGDVWPGEGEVLKGTGKTPVAGGVHDWVTCGLRELGLRVDWGGVGLASHSSGPPPECQECTVTGEGGVLRGEAQQ